MIEPPPEPLNESLRDALSLPPSSGYFFCEHPDVGGNQRKKLLGKEGKEVSKPEARQIWQSSFKERRRDTVSGFLRTWVD